ncbi:ATP-binding protein [Geomonas sp. Red32]|uniref:sensor histidine kinase n=1 Tax=Geomonas sp. Red32 TaxID=2912856 RepID=UPI00202CE2DA|nr:ATP-binding protein [Geomonas sp. Red32]
MIDSFYRFFLSRSLRTHLVLMVLLLSLPAVALITYSSWQQRRAALNEGLTEANLLARGILSEQYNLTGDAQQLAMALAQLADVKMHRAGAVNRVLADIMRITPEYSNIVITDRTGDIWASALPFNQSISLRGNRAFENALRTRNFSSGEAGLGKISGKPNLGFGCPYFGSGGEVAGAIIISIDFAHLNQLLLESGLPSGTSFLLADHQGVVIYRNREAGLPIGSRLSRAELASLQGETGGALRTGDDTIVAHGNLKLHGEETPYLYLSTVLPVQQTMVNARRAELTSVAILSPVLLVAVLIATFIGKVCLVNRIRSLQEASHRLAGGDLGTRVSDAVRGGELGELGQAFDEMASRLAARDRELVELNQGLSQRVEEETERRLQHERLLARHARLAAMGEMIGAIAHQWRQPLATLGAVIQSLRMAWERGMLDGRFLEKAEGDAQKQLYYMSDTIEDFRNFFSPEKVEESFDVREKIQEVMLLVSAQFANSGIALRLKDRAGGRPLIIRGYHNEFKQSVLNLVSNAFDAVAARWGRGDTSSGQGMVEISLDGGEESAVIEVFDNGCGIPADIAEKIWEPYFTSKTDGKGTGIGLYMAKLIVEESMGGDISFRSDENGTVFQVVLPQQPQRETGGGAAAEGGPLPHGPSPVPRPKGERGAGGGAVGGAVQVRPEGEEPR